MTKLPLFWWVRNVGMWHAYVAPLYVTLHTLWLQMHGKRAHWIAARAWDPPHPDEGRWMTPARVCLGHMECVPHGPRWLIEAECAFWNGRIGIWLRKRGVG